MEIRDFYQILNISHNSSPDYVEKAFNDLSKNYSSNSLVDKFERSAYTDLFTAYYILYQEEPRLVYEECIAKLSGKDKAKFTDYELSLYIRYNSLLADSKKKALRSLSRRTEPKKFDVQILGIFLIEMVTSLLFMEFLNRAVLGPILIVLGFFLATLFQTESLKDLIIGIALIIIGVLMIWFKLKDIKREYQLE